MLVVETRFHICQSLTLLIELISELLFKALLKVHTFPDIIVLGHHGPVLFPLVEFGGESVVSGLRAVSLVPRRDEAQNFGIIQGDVRFVTVKARNAVAEFIIQPEGVEIIVSKLFDFSPHFLFRKVALFNL